MNNTHHKQQMSRLLSVPVLLCSLFYYAMPTARAADTWQEKQLYQPSAQQLDREQKGFVNIYSGFTDRQVLAALDQQFDRVESMMFIKTVVTDEHGEAMVNEETGMPVTEDDDC